MEYNHLGRSRFASINMCLFVGNYCFVDYCFCTVSNRVVLRED